MSSRYTTGLQNVGSYQVSGQPWMKNHAFAGVESKFYEFPNVTDYIKITNDVAAAGTGNLDIVFCEPRRSVNMADHPSNQNLSTSITAAQEVTLSMWVKFETLASTPGDVRLANFTGTGIDIRVQTRSGDEIRTIINSTTDGSDNETTTTSPLAIDEWFNIAFIVKSGDTKVYLNGALLAQTVNAQTFPETFDTLSLGSNSSNHDGLYSNIYLFNRALTEAEIAKVYSGSYKISPDTENSIDGLVSWWAFEDNHYKAFFATPDTTTTIFDRISSNNLVVSTGTLAFEDGYLIGIALDRHTITLEGQQEIRLNCKSKQVFLKSTGGTSVNVSAGLTGIPAERMFDLTGPGIDE